MKNYKYTVEEDFFNNGIKVITYLNENRKIHRENGPAFQKFYKNGKIKYCSYLVKGKRHRLDGPAVQSFNSDGTLAGCSYWFHDKLHRLDGPAIQEFNSNGKLLREEYWIDGEMFSKEQFEKKTSKASFNDKVVEIEGKKYKLIELKE